MKTKEPRLPQREENVKEFEEILKKIEHQERFRLDIGKVKTSSRNKLSSYGVTYFQREAMPYKVIFSNSHLKEKIKECQEGRKLLNKDILKNEFCNADTVDGFRKQKADEEYAMVNSPKPPFKTKEMSSFYHKYFESPNQFYANSPMNKVYRYEYNNDDKTQKPFIKQEDLLNWGNIIKTIEKNKYHQANLRYLDPINNFPALQKNSYSIQGNNILRSSTLQTIDKTERSLPSKRLRKSMSHVINFKGSPVVEFTDNIPTLRATIDTKRTQATIDQNKEIKYKFYKRANEKTIGTLNLSFKDLPPTKVSKCISQQINLHREKKRVPQISVVTMK